LAVRIVGTIGGELFGPGGAIAEDLAAALEFAPNAEDIDVDLESRGGDFFEGVRMYQLLSEHPAKVHVSIGSIAASAASVIAMAGDDIAMHETSTTLVHAARCPIFGTAEEMRKRADTLDTLTEAMVTAYSARTGKSADDIRSLMSEEKYLSAKEALALGLCTEIRKAKKGVRAIDESEVRAGIEAMRTQTMVSATALQIAAIAPPKQTQPSKGKEQPKMDPNLILADLGLPEGATTDTISAFAASAKGAAEANAKIFAALDVDSLDKAVGAIEAFKGLAERATKAEAELQAIRSETAKAKHEALVASALDPNSSSQHAGKLTPAEKTWALSVSTETLEGFLAVAPAVLKGDGKREPKASNGASSKEAKEVAPQWNGKTYAQLSNSERFALADENQELFNEMRDHALTNRLI